MNGTSLAVAAAMEEQGGCDPGDRPQRPARRARHTPGLRQHPHREGRGRREPARPRTGSSTPPRDLARHSSEIKRELQGFLAEMQAA